MQLLFVCKDRYGSCTGVEMRKGDPILNFPGHSVKSGESSHKPLELLWGQILPSLKADITCPGLYTSYNVTLTAKGKLTKKLQNYGGTEGGNGRRGMGDEEQIRCEDKENRLKIHLNFWHPS